MKRRMMSRLIDGIRREKPLSNQQANQVRDSAAD